MSEEVFEITDFTTASDWERFVSDLEEVLTRWDLCGKDSSASLISREELSRGVWTQRHESIGFSKTTFSLVFHKLLESREEVAKEDNQTIPLPQAALDGQREEMDWPSKAHCVVRYFGVRAFLVLSAVDDSVANEDRLRLVTSSAVMALHATHCRLPLLVEWSRARRLFSGVAVNESSRVDFQMIQIRQSARFKFLDKTLDLLRSHVTPDSSLRLSVRLTFVLNQFPDHWTEGEEPLLELQMAAVWPSLSEESVIDSENVSDLDPNSAQKWILRPLWRQRVCSLSEKISKMKSLDARQIIELNLEEKEIKSALKVLTNEESAREKRIRDLVRDHVFVLEEEFCEDFGLKSAPINSLVWKLGLALTDCCDEEEIRLLWSETVDRVRQCWEARRVMTSSARIDLNFGLLAQKLAMIDRCIVEMKSREEEFFDAEEDLMAEERPEGRLRRSEFRRVSQPEDWIWIPETQEAPPMTEDMLSDQIQVLQQLGTSVLGAGIRAKMQSAGLLSDMSSFKAANVSASFEDFIRWHSPRDCDAEGRLSARFQSADNVWREVWVSAEPLSARKQKPLFDAETEAEKVLHFFSALSFKDLSQLLIPILIHHSFRTIRDQRRRLGLDPLDMKDSEEVVKEIQDQEVLIQRLSSLAHKFRLMAQLETELEDSELLSWIRTLVIEGEVEMPSFGIWSDLVRKLFAESLLFSYQKTLSVGERVDSVQTMPEAVAREFIVRTWCPSPAGWSRSSPQRLYCCWTREETRLALESTQDLTYF